MMYSLKGKKTEKEETAVFENGQDQSDKSTSKPLSEEMTNVLEQISKRYLNFG